MKYLFSAVSSRLVAVWLAVLLGLAGLTALPFATPVAGGEGAPNSLGLDATYDVSATVRWQARKLVVSSVATITNSTDQEVPGFTFNLVPAAIGRIVLGQVLVDGSAAVAQHDDQNVIVDLAAPLQPGAEATVSIDYTATFGKRPGGKRYLFEKTDGVAAAYRWIPWLSRVYTFKSSATGEPVVTQVTREVSVRLSSDNAQVKFATSGQLVASEGGVEHYVAHDVRDFNFSASPRYQVTSETHAGVQFDYYTDELPQATLANLARSAFNRYTALVGAYPYPRLVIAETANGHGMESPGMIWIPRTTPAANLRFLVRHEIAHQWFYAVVGNDQAREPFADEGMTEMLTRTIIGFRKSQCPQSTLDQTIYEYSRACYYEIVYIQGSNYLNQYRKRVGDEAFWTGVRLYYERYAFRIGGTLELLQTLDEVAPEGSSGGHEERFPSLFPAP